MTTTAMSPRSGFLPGSLTARTAEIEIEIVSTVRAVPRAEWDRVVGGNDPLWSHGLFCAAEDGRIGPTSFHHLIARRGERVVGILPTQRFARLPLGDVLGHAGRRLLEPVHRRMPALTTIDALVIGNLLGDGRPRIDPGDHRPRAVEWALVSAVGELRRELGCAWTVWKDVPEGNVSLITAARENRFFDLPALPDTVITLAGPTFDDHLLSLPGKARRNDRAKRRRLFADPTVRLEVRDEVDAAAESLAQLYRNVLDRAEERLEVLTPEFLRALARHDTGTQFIVARRDDQVLGFLIWITRGTSALAFRVGLDYERAPEVFAYHNLHFRGLELALEAGCDTVQMLQTAYEAKREMGARPVPLVHLVTHRNPLLRWVLGRVLPYAVATPVGL